MNEELKYVFDRIYISKDVEECITKLGDEYTIKLYPWSFITIDDSTLLELVNKDELLTPVVNIVPLDECTKINIYTTSDLITPTVSLKLSNKFAVITSDLTGEDGIINLNIKTELIDTTGIESDIVFPFYKGIEIFKETNRKSSVVSLKFLPNDSTFKPIIYKTISTDDTINATMKLISEFKDIDSKIAESTVLFNPVTSQVCIIKDFCDYYMTCLEIHNEQSSEHKEQIELVNICIPYNNNLTSIRDCNGFLNISNNEFHPIQPVIYIEYKDEDDNIMYAPYSYTSNNMDIDYMNILNEVPLEELSDTVLDLHSACETANSIISTLQQPNSAEDVDYLTLLDNLENSITGIMASFNILSVDDDNGIFIPLGKKFRFINIDILKSYNNIYIRYKSALLNKDNE